MQSIDAIRRVLESRGWPTSGVVITQDGPPVGAWQAYIAFTTTPSGTLADVWAGPRAAVEPSEIIVAGWGIDRAQLRQLIAGRGNLRAIAQIVVKTAGHGREIGDPETGENMGLPAHLEGLVHPPRIEATPHGQELIFYARTYSGAYVRVHAPTDGFGPVALTIEPPGPITGSEPARASSGGPGPAPPAPRMPRLPDAEE